MNMKYKKISMQEIVGSLGFSDWVLIRDYVNRETGYIVDIPEQEMLARQVYKATGNLTSYENLRFAEFLTDVRTGQRHEKVEVICLPGKRIIFKLIDASGAELSPSRFSASFECPECEQLYEVECNPSRFNRTCSLCRKCQKSYIHKCESYQKKYEDAMLKSHGVKRPLQNVKIQEKMQETLLAKLGTRYAMQSEVVKQRHAENMLKAHGRSNYFCGINAWDRWQPFKHGFVSKLEKELSELCLDIFGNQGLCCLTKKHKFKHDIRWFSPDFYDPILDVMIEFNGDFFHANPQIFSEKKSFHRGKSFHEIREEEANRFACLKQHCPNVFVIWEFDWKKHSHDIKVMLQEVKSAVSNKTLVQREKLLGWQP